MNQQQPTVRDILIPFSAQMLDLVVQALMQRAYGEVAHVVQHITGHVNQHNAQVLADLKAPTTGEIIGYAGRAPEGGTSGQTDPV